MYPKEKPSDQEAKGVECTRRNNVSMQSGKIPILKGDELCPPLERPRHSQTAKCQEPADEDGRRGAWQTTLRGATLRLDEQHNPDCPTPVPAVRVSWTARRRWSSSRSQWPEDNKSCCNSFPEPVTPRCRFVSSHMDNSTPAAFLFIVRGN